MQGSRPEGFLWGTYMTCSDTTASHTTGSNQITKQLMPAQPPRSLAFNDHDSTGAAAAGGSKTESNIISSVAHVPKREILNDDEGATITAANSKSTTTTPSTSTGGSVGEGSYDQTEVWGNLQRLASENAVVMFSISSCCVCHVVKRLFSSLGVAPAVYELDQEDAGPEITSALQSLAGSSQALPAIFIGKKYIGGLKELIAAHIGAALVPQLKQAGALWL